MMHDDDATTRMTPDPAHHLRLAHRAAVAMALAGIGPRGPAAAPAAAEAIWIGAGSAPAAPAALLLGIDDAAADVDAVAARLATARSALTPNGALALFVSAGGGLALHAAARALGRAPLRNDPHAAALRWGLHQDARDAALAAAMDPDRLIAVTHAADASGLTLVEPDLAPLVPAVARLAERMRSPVERVLLVTSLFGQIARPLLFVPRAAAPRGLARLRPERLGDAWVLVRGGALSSASSPVSSAGEASLVRAAWPRVAAAALTGLAPAGAEAPAADATRTPVPFGALLRRARALRGDAAATDARHLAEALILFALDGAVDFALAAPPASPPGVG